MNARTNAMIRRSANAGVAGPILFAVVVVIAAFFFDGYSHLDDKISELGGADAGHAWIQGANFAVLGLLVIVFAWGLAGHLGRPWRGAVLLGFFGLSSGIFNAVFPCDADCAGATTVGLLHNVTGMAGFLSAIAGMVLLSRRWRTDDEWQAHVQFTYGAVGMTIAGLIWFVALEASGATRWNGLAQRTFVVALLGWIAVTGLRLRRLAPLDHQPASRTSAGAGPTTLRA